MLKPATLRERRLRMTKAQLIDEIETLEQRADAIEATYRSGAPMRAKASDHYLANQELADLARFPSEDPNPVLRVMPDGTVLYANDAAIAVNGLFKGRNKSTLAGDIAGFVPRRQAPARSRKPSSKAAIASSPSRSHRLPVRPTSTSMGTTSPSANARNPHSRKKLISSSYCTG